MTVCSRKSVGVNANYQMFPSVFFLLFQVIKKLFLPLIVTMLVPSSARASRAQWHIPIWAAAADYFQFEVLTFGLGELLPARTGLPTAPASPILHRKTKADRMQRAPRTYDVGSVSRSSFQIQSSWDTQALEAAHLQCPWCDHSGSFATRPLLLNVIFFYMRGKTGSLLLSRTGKFKAIVQFFLNPSFNFTRQLLLL